MTDENKNKKPMMFVIMGFILIVISIIVIFVFGVRGIFKIIGTIMVVALFCSLVFGIIYLFWWLFLKKHRYDVTYVNKQKLVLAGKINQQKGVLGDLYISGDEGHSRVQLGKIIGYVRIQILAKLTKYNDDGSIKYKPEVEGEPREADYDLDKEEQDVFIVSKGGLAGFFGEPLVIRVNPDDHDSLIGDITLKGFSIIPHSEYWFLNKDHLDVRKIDFAILKEAERGIFFEGLRDMKTIIDKSIGLDSDHKKKIEEKNLVDIPDQVTG